MKFTKEQTKIILRSLKDKQKTVLPSTTYFRKIESIINIINSYRAVEAAMKVIGKVFRNLHPNPSHVILGEKGRTIGVYNFSKPYITTDGESVNYEKTKSILSKEFKKDTEKLFDDINKNLEKLGNKTKESDINKLAQETQYTVDEIKEYSETNNTTGDNLIRVVKILHAANEPLDF